MFYYFNHISSIKLNPSLVTFADWDSNYLIMFLMMEPLLWSKITGFEPVNPPI